MSYSKDNDGNGLNTVANDVSGVSVVNDPFAKLIGHILYRAAETRLIAQHFDTPAKSAYGSFSGADVFRGKKPVKALYIKQRSGRPS
jgi:hypothetical protein